MKEKIIMLLTGMLLASGVATAIEALPAFPGAQGGGATSVGGRGGVVFVVTTLADSGIGSLRDCVEASKPRTCVFRRGGTITLERMNLTWLIRILQLLDKLHRAVGLL